MMSQWYIRRGDQSKGPFSTADLRSMAKKGLLKQDDLLWKEGFEQPKKARVFKELFDSPKLPKSLSADTGQVIENNMGSKIPVASKKNRGSGTGFVDAGINVSSPALAMDRNRLDNSFGTAVRQTIDTAIVALAELLRSPIKYAFGTLVMLIACLLSIAGLITGLLVPVFVLGYISYIKSILSGEQVSLGNFISFLRHGWDSLWHLFMLVAAFFLAAAISMAPFVIAGLIAYLCFGSLGIAGLKLLSVLNGGPDIPNMGGGFGFGGSDLNPWLAGLFYVAVILPVLAIPTGVILILIYCLALMVSTEKVAGENKYDLVYNSFVRMLQIALHQWKRLTASGFWLVSIPFFGLLLLAILLAIVAPRLPFFSVWIMAILTPLAAISFVIYLNLFAVLTSMQLVKSMDSSSFYGSDSQGHVPTVLVNQVPSL
jgi:hypothetical protein